MKKPGRRKSAGLFHEPCAGVISPKACPSNSYVYSWNWLRDPYLGAPHAWLFKGKLIGFDQLALDATNVHQNNAGCFVNLQFDALHAKSQKLSAGLVARRAVPSDVAPHRSDRRLAHGRQVVHRVRPRFFSWGSDPVELAAAHRGVVQMPAAHRGQTPNRCCTPGSDP